MIPPPPKSTLFPYTTLFRSAISGEHTVSGKPLLSNDMHLAHQIPNIWYEAHLKSGDYDVAGLALPGLPFVMVGDRKSTRLNSNHVRISYAVFCLKKKTPTL